MTLSIITITYNNYEELIATCNSLKKISTKFEHVIINGGNCDLSFDFLESYKQSSNVTVINEPDEGSYDAFNKGVLCSTGDCISFLNSGDLLNDSTYHGDALKLINDGKVDFVHAGILFDDQKYGEYKLHPKKGHNPGKGMPFMHPSMVVKKDFFQTHGLFNKQFKIAGDFDWACKLWREDYKDVYLIRYPVKMNNRGVSSQNEALALDECKNALIQNDLYRGKVKLFFGLRVLKYILRRSLRVFDFFKLGTFYKKFLAQ